MKQLAKMLAATCFAALALSAVAAAGASAAEFTGTAGDEITGTQTSAQVFAATENGQKVTCKKAHTTGKIAAPAAVTQEVTVIYSECTAQTFIGTFPATISEATYELNANGTVKILNTITISVPAAGCSTTVGPQGPLGTIAYDDKEVGGQKEIEETSAVRGIVSASNFPCPAGTTGTYTGNNLVEDITGADIIWHA